MRPTDLSCARLDNFIDRERNVTRAAERIHLSRSEMSRTLERLRSELGDELLVRVGLNYELTPRGSELLDELAQVMPRLARLWAERPSGMDKNRFYGPYHRKLRPRTSGKEPALRRRSASGMGSHP
ncbi:helix-turn-helix domain-containing protein [Bryocella elongata]|uniref:helix-turn-helix domain-containing protein n=1 Tax=Bryocella elongata TaxID=863522 RepID=UPI00190EEC8C|nr:LysR family transcriptional regulator [Bryocella elongata]